MYLKFPTVWKKFVMVEAKKHKYGHKQAQVWIRKTTILKNQNMDMAYAYLATVVLQS